MVSPVRSGCVVQSSFNLSPPDWLCCQSDWLCVGFPTDLHGSCAFLFPDNVFAIKSWTKKKFSFNDSRINKAFGIPDDFDYMDWPWTFQTHPWSLFLTALLLIFVFILSGGGGTHPDSVYSVRWKHISFPDAFYQGINYSGATGEGTEPPAVVRSHRVLWQTAWLFGHLLTWNWELRADDGQESTFPLALVAFGWFKQMV